MIPSNSSNTSFQNWYRAASDFGMLFVLLILSVFFSLLTLEEQQPEGASAAASCWAKLSNDDRQNAHFLAGPDEEFAEAIRRLAGPKEAQIYTGEPSGARKLLEGLDALRGTQILVLSPPVAQWKLMSNLSERFPDLPMQIIKADSYRWPNFLKRENLLNITAQILVYAIIAVGMTLVIMTSGIDLSVGSLVALSAVLITRCIRDFGGGAEASPLTLVLFGCLTILLCALVGSMTGLVVSLFDIPPFIATLAMMMIASGTAYQLSSGESIDQVPESFVWLGRGALLGIPNAIWILGTIYFVTHIVMTRMAYGRCVLAVGGNREAARLAGIPVRPILVSTYVLCSMLAGFGGIILASQLKSGAAVYGEMYELYVIAAVVVGGTSLRGGEGNVLNTLIGALIIAVIQNGMNLMNIGSYTQKIVFGIVILAAVLFDNLRRGRRKV